MKLFSERYGYKKVRDSLQFECMDEELRISIWNYLYEFGIDNESSMPSSLGMFPPDVQSFYLKLWTKLWRKTIDSQYPEFKFPYSVLRNYFFDCEWYEVYDFLDFFAENFPHDDLELFITSINEVLESENSGYRFIDYTITPIHTETDIESIENAMKNSPDPIQIHLQEALKLLSDRNSPNYRNSIKESISAVESICKLITKHPKTTLGKCLNKIGKSIELHPSLIQAFQKLYGYTSDSNGIRHALLDEPTLDSEDAIFMLVSCSTFINYLITKTKKASIILDPKQETFPEIFESLKITLKNNGVNYEQIITDFGQVEASKKRDRGHEFTFEKHLKALIYSMLSNRRKWIDIVDKIPQIDKIFYNFDSEKLEQCDTEELIKEIKRIKGGNISIDKQIKALPHNIRQLKKIENDFRTLDNFVTHDSPAKVVKLISNRQSKYKIIQVGDALALEYLKSVGIKGMKPDVHIERICGSERLNLIPPQNTEKQLEKFKYLSESVNVSETYLDNIFWIFGAKGFGEICTDKPQCHKCKLNNYCNYQTN